MQGCVLYNMFDPFMYRFVGYKRARSTSVDLHPDESGQWSNTSQPKWNFTSPVLACDIRAFEFWDSENKKIAVLGEIESGLHTSRLR